MAETEDEERELLAQAARLAEEFGLGSRMAARAVRRHSARFGGGLSLLLVAGVGGLPLIAVSTGMIQEAVAIAGGCLVVIGGALMALSPRVKQDRLFQYTGGLAQLISGEPEPLVVRWDDAVTISVTYGSVDVAPRPEQVVICGRTGTCVTIDEKYSLPFVRELAAEAESVLTARLVPELIETYESGRPVAFGDMTIDQWGITYDGASGEPWRTPWENIRRIGIDGPGHGIRIRTSRPMGGKWINLDGCLNGIVAHHLIQHAVARFDVPIHHVDRLRGSGGSRACQEGRTMRAG